MAISPVSHLRTVLLPTPTKLSLIHISGNEDTGLDELFHDAAQQVILSGQASASFLQRRFRIGYNRAARLVESLEQMGIVGPLEGNKRQVLMNMEDFTLLFGNGN